jgi:hypothetical protein
VNRRALGRGRILVAAGAIVTVVGLFPQWWSIARTNAEALSGNGLQGPGIIIFLAAMGLLAVIVVPFTTRDGDSAFDRPLAYVALALVAISAYLFRVYEIASFARLALPTEAPGMWITGFGLFLVSWGVAEILTEKPPIF